MQAAGWKYDIKNSKLLNYIQVALRVSASADVFNFILMSDYLLCTYLSETSLDPSTYM